MTSHDVIPMNKNIRELWSESNFFSKYLSLLTDPEKIAAELSRMYEEPMNLETRMEYLQATYLFFKKFGIKTLEDNRKLLRSLVGFDKDNIIPDDFFPELSSKVPFLKKMGHSFFSGIMGSRIESYERTNKPEGLLVDVNSEEYETLDKLMSIFEKFKINTNVLVFLPAEVRQRLIDALEDMDGTAPPEQLKKDKINFIVAVLLESVLERLRTDAGPDFYLRFVIMLGRLPVDERGQMIYYFMTSEELLQDFEERAGENPLDSNDPLLRREHFAPTDDELNREIKGDISKIQKGLEGLGIRKYVVKDYNLEDAERLVQGEL